MCLLAVAQHRLVNENRCSLLFLWGVVGNIIIYFVVICCSGKPFVFAFRLVKPTSPSFAVSFSTAAQRTVTPPWAGGTGMSRALQGGAARAPEHIYVRPYIYKHIYIYIYIYRKHIYIYIYISADPPGTQRLRTWDAVCFSTVIGPAFSCSSICCYSISSQTQNST